LNGIDNPGDLLRKSISSEGAKPIGYKKGI